jgi:hypothetical protein
VGKRAGIILAVVMGLVALLPAIGELWDLATSSETTRAADRAMRIVAETPLVRLVLADNPDLKAEVRAEIEQAVPYRRPSLVTAIGARIRRDFIKPALRNADDASAVKAASAMEAFTRYLQTLNVRLCTEFGVYGLGERYKLDPEGTVLFKRALKVQEEAFRSGQARASKPAPGRDRIVRLFALAGYNDHDVRQQFEPFDKLPAVDACAATVRRYGAPARLPAPENAALARWVIAAGP